jgi:hypothetical protein
MSGINMGRTTALVNDSSLWLGCTANNRTPSNIPWSQQVMDSTVWFQRSIHARHTVVSIFKGSFFAHVTQGPLGSDGYLNICCFALKVFQKYLPNHVPVTPFWAFFFE